MREEEEKKSLSPIIHHTDACLDRPLPVHVLAQRSVAATPAPPLLTRTQCREQYRPSSCACSRVAADQRKRIARTHTAEGKTKQTEFIIKLPRDSLVTVTEKLFSR